MGVVVCKITTKRKRGEEVYVSLCPVWKQVRKVMKLTAIILFFCLLSSALANTRTITGHISEERAKSDKEGKAIKTAQGKGVTINLPGEFDLNIIRVAIRDLDKEQIVTHGLTTFNPNYIYEL